jgi:hypothetical protein
LDVRVRTWDFTLQLGDSQTPIAKVAAALCGTNRRDRKLHCLARDHMVDRIGQLDQD